MIVGVGIDTVRISEMTRLCDDAFAAYAFTDDERVFAQSRHNPVEAYAGMFAVKEAVTKAVCTLAPDDWIDFRLIEVRHDEHGAPRIAYTPPLSGYLEKVGVGSVLVSITHEGDLATAFAVAQTEPIEGSCIAP